MTQDDGGPAFPGWREFPGMTLRDYFAAKAIGMFMLQQFDFRRERVHLELGDPALLDLLAQFSYKLADAMLAARKT